MKYYKKIIGKKCYLSPISLDDAGKYAEWLNDLEVSQYLTLRSLNINMDTEKAALEKLSQEHNYAIIDKRNDELIGNCGFVELDNLNNTGEVGIFIGNKEYWGKGYGTEALRLLISYGINYLNIRNIMIRVFSFNARAIRSYKKIGFKEIGVRRKSIKFNKQEHDIIFMDLLSEEYI